MKKTFILILSVFALHSVQSQSVLDEYKYIEVPEKFDFFKEADKYQLNSLTRFLFKKEGFVILPEAANLPEDFKQNRCLALHTRVNNNSNMFTSKLVIELVDCNNKVVFTSKEGKSKQKEYKAGFHEALREAFESVKALNYSYKPAKQLASIPSIVVSAMPKQEGNNSAPLIKSTPIDNVSEVVTRVNENTLYAQPVKNGFQLVDTTPKVVYVLQKTSVENVYLIKDKQGTVFFSDGKWIAEYYEGEELKREELNIKF
ncbi:hypothetical protein [Abyssalbus ytuae]|uniref:Secreted protein n=1 Tax=Abyssalbus ytuae TaxID=2926907 RepID=A0A9E6ZKQ3_9FLAO|nr:hypothetical protein [Abyssalbus ytuae]UOB16369.1 hypothetical protein MQE35_11550 [Abyssalbus ytuae]